MIPLAYINVVANNHDRKQGDLASKSKPPRFEANKNHGTGGHTKLFSMWNELDTKLKIPGSEFNKSKIEQGHLYDHVLTGHLKKVAT